MYQNYDSKTLLKAINGIETSKQSLRIGRFKMADKHGVPKSTLYDYIKKRSKRINKPGGQSVLSEIGENYLTGIFR